MSITHETRVRLWDAINRYAQTCGGDPSKHVYGNIARMNAVVDVEQVLRDAAFEEPERTPDVVLRAMLRAYEAALFAAHVAYMRGDKTFDGARRVDRLAADTDAVRGAAAWVAAGNAEVGLSEYRLADYTARLAGTRPLNAPPLEV
mgnify:CR=1 FL=1